MSFAEQVTRAFERRAAARTRDEWIAAGEWIKTLANGDRIAREIGALKLETFGGYTVRQALGASGVLVIAAHLHGPATAPVLEDKNG